VGGTVTKARPWPNNARNARDRAAEETQAALRTAESLLDYLDEHNSLNQFEILVAHKKAAKIRHNLERALRHLESVGAQTQPQ
jgi:hypothetical protein